MSYAEDLYNRLTSGMANTDQYLAKLSDRGQPSEAEMAALGAPATGLAGAVRDMGALGEEGRDYVRSVIGKAPQSMPSPSSDVTRISENIANQVGSPNLRGAMGAVNAMGSMGEAMTPQKVPMNPGQMGGMNPSQRDQYFQSFEDAGINLTPGAGVARGLLNMDQAITNATTAPNVLQQNQLQNIAGGQSNVSPYGLGLGQQMYNPEMLRGLLGF